MVGRTQPRVLDFGIAHIGQRHEMPAAQELAGGSPYYMAPEQLLQQPLDARCDVYSLGVVLYELLTGERPFRGDTLDAIQRAVLEAQPAPAHERAPGVPRALAAIIAQAMARERSGRPASAAAMARELHQWLDAQPAAVAAASQPGPAATPARRRDGSGCRRKAAPHWRVGPSRCRPPGAWSGSMPRRGRRSRSTASASASRRR
jgi:serine/threonine-protein kinase